MDHETFSKKKKCIQLCIILYSWIPPLEQANYYQTILDKEAVNNTKNMLEIMVMR
jgi:hypothetical protein